MNRPIILQFIFFIFLNWAGMSEAANITDGNFPAKVYTISSNEDKICEKTFIPIPKSPFTILLFCGDGLGHYLRILYSGFINYNFGSWFYDDRFWKDESWGADIKSFVWDSKGKNLFVSTNEIYGNGGIYQLDLVNRTSHKISKETGEIGRRFEILKIDFAKNSLKYEVATPASSSGAKNNERTEIKEIKFHLSKTLAYPKK